MAKPQHGGARKPDRKPRPPAGPGKRSQRTDMSKVTPAGMPASGVYNPTVADSPDLQYGDASRLAKAQTSVPLPSGSIPPAPAVSGAPSKPSPPRGAPQGAPAAPGPGLDPRALLALVSGHPTDRPNDPLVAQQAPPSGSLAFKIDALRHLSSLPWAGPEIHSLLERAQVEYDQAQVAKFRPRPTYNIPSGEQPISIMGAQPAPAPQAAPSYQEEPEVAAEPVEPAVEATAPPAAPVAPDGQGIA